MLLKITRTDLVETREERTVYVRANSPERGLELAAQDYKWIFADGSNTEITPVELEGEEGVLAVEYARGSDKPHAVKVTTSTAYGALYGRYDTHQEAVDVMNGVLAQVRAGTTPIQTVRLAHAERRGSWGLGKEYDVRQYRLDFERANGTTGSENYEGSYNAGFAMDKKVDKDHRKNPGLNIVRAELFRTVPGKADESVRQYVEEQEAVSA